MSLAIATVAGFLGKQWRPPVASEHGVGVDRVIDYQLVTTGVIFLLGHIVLAWFIWRSCSDNPGIWRKPSRKAEWGWALLPVIAMTVIAEVGVLVIGGPVWDLLYGELPEGAAEIEVVALQFAWVTRYPGEDGEFGRTDPYAVDSEMNPLGLVEEDPAAHDDIVIVGLLHLVKDQPVRIRLRSHDVLHAFTIPEFRVKQDIVPGYTGSTQFRPTKLGEFQLACAELCGLGHYSMRSQVMVQEQAEFDQWLSEQFGQFE